MGTIKDDLAELKDFDGKSEKGWFIEEKDEYIYKVYRIKNLLADHKL